MGKEHVQYEEGDLLVEIYEEITGKVCCSLYIADMHVEVLVERHVLLNIAEQIQEKLS